MTTKHTPGPWEAIRTAVYSVSGREIIYHSHNTRCASLDERLANARLIAAAPELLEALEAMLEVQSRRRHPLGMPDEGIAIDAAESACKARAAIAKAKGE